MAESEEKPINNQATENTEGDNSAPNGPNNDAAGASEDLANDDEKAIKRAYRKRMSEHHPDKLASKGLPEQAMEIAKRKAQDIQAAYEMIKQHRQFK